MKPLEAKNASKNMSNQHDNPILDATAERNPDQPTVADVSEAITRLLNLLRQTAPRTKDGVGSWTGC